MKNIKKDSYPDQNFRSLKSGISRLTDGPKPYRFNGMSSKMSYDPDEQTEENKVSRARYPSERTSYEQALPGQFKSNRRLGR